MNAELLHQQVNAFFAGGGQVEKVAGFEGIAPMPRHRNVIGTPPKKPRKAISRQPVVFTADELERIRTLAKVKTRTEVARIVGHSRSALERLAEREGFAFVNGTNHGQFAMEVPDLTPERRQYIAERLDGYRKLGLTRHQAKKRSELSDKLFNHLCRESGILWSEP